MKSIIVFLLTGLASVSASATPVPFDHATSFDAADSVRFDDALIDAAFAIEQWDDPLVLVPTTNELNPGPANIVFAQRPRFSKVCQSGRMNAWGFGGGCYANSDRPQSVPEPGTLVLLGAGLFLLALAQRQRRIQATAGR